MGILLVINIVASVYDVQFRVPKIQKKLENEAAEIAKRQTSNGELGLSMLSYNLVHDIGKLNLK